LWLMTAEGGDPLQLTYGEFDATAPRWSPAGDRVAYVSNEYGNTSLWVVDVPGGARRRVALAGWTLRDPAGLLTIQVADSATRRLVPARVSVLGEDGRYFAPIDAWRHADEAFDRRERRFEYGYFHTAGLSSV